jgi:hypothetical protein
VSWSIVFLIIVTIAAFGGIMWWGRTVLREHPIRAIAVICVAIIGAYVMWMGWLHTDILKDPNWCNKAIQAERITPGTSFQGLTACVDLLKIQLNAEATNSHIYAGSAAITLVALIVIVIAQGRAQLQGPGGIGGSFGPGSDPPETPVAKAATTVATAAVDAAKEVVAEQPGRAQAAPGEDG